MFILYCNTPGDVTSFVMRVTGPPRSIPPPSTRFDAASHHAVGSGPTPYCAHCCLCKSSQRNQANSQRLACYALPRRGCRFHACVT